MWTIPSAGKGLVPAVGIPAFFSLDEGAASILGTPAALLRAILLLSSLPQRRLL